ncbi:uncharacterized protein [Cicer arietinum]|uniref:Uncharacterized protein LOC101494636 isoform X3 n=1 Tax=Cicer arietinum TaxID=3827 RepID=A0A1S3DX12_CICAR|nr:uncharacterized protein LOC101494636 isoform X3 [Cicer arietinum]
MQLQTMASASKTLTLCQCQCQWWSSSTSSSSSLHIPSRVTCRASESHPQQLSVDKTICQIKTSGVIACLRANSAEVALEAANVAIAGGISVVGTVLRIEDAKTAINAGAKFLMSPANVKDIMDYVQGREVLYIPGAMTPTEILSAYDAGAKMVKIYPVSALGGFQYIEALKKPFPHVSMVASQGITIDSIVEYITRGASSVVLSDAIFDKEAIAECNFSKIYKLAQSATMLGNQAVNR